MITTTKARLIYLHTSIMFPLPADETVGLLGVSAGGRGHIRGGGAGGLGEAVHLGVLSGQLQPLNVQPVF